jgi:hypothetical protein
MSARAWMASLSCLAALVVAGTAPAYPPITCGRVSVKGKTYVVHTHGPSCSYASHWIKVFIKYRHGPSGWSCRGYGAQVPADCTKGKRRYFFANPAAG